MRALIVDGVIVAFVVDQTEGQTDRTTPGQTKRLTARDRNRDCQND